MLRDRRLLLVSAAAIVAVFVWVAALLPGRPVMRVTFFDVGDGACTLIQTPAGKTLVVDCGTSSWRDPSAVGEKLLAPYLRSRGLDQIDVLVLTHPHADHISGVPGLLKHAPAKLVVVNGDKEHSPEYFRCRRALKSYRPRHRMLRRGQRIDMGDGVVAEVISPADSPFVDPNDRSIVLKIRFGHVAVLLSSDAGEEAEAEIIASGADLRAQVLQVGHHGSRRSTTPQWLAAVSPSIAVISCSGRSRYGFPSRRVLERLASFGVRTYATGRAGAVTVVTDGSSVRVDPFRSSR